MSSQFIHSSVLLAAWQKHYSGPVLLLRAKMDTWHKCLDVSFRSVPEQQTNLPLKVSKPRSGLLYHYLITHYDCGILVFRIHIHGHELMQAVMGHENSLYNFNIIALSKLGVLCNIKYKQHYRKYKYIKYKYKNKYRNTENDENNENYW